jgi:hypothetical protein
LPPAYRTHQRFSVADLLAKDQHIPGKIEYEPDLLPDGRKIDFIADRRRDNLYVEVKTVHPRTADTEAAWKGYLRRRQHHPVTLSRVEMKNCGHVFITASRCAGAKKLVDQDTLFTTGK